MAANFWAAKSFTRFLVSIFDTYDILCDYHGRASTGNGYSGKYVYHISYFLIVTNPGRSCKSSYMYFARGRSLI